jgi:hypothetical protein
MRWLVPVSMIAAAVALVVMMRDPQQAASVSSIPGGAIDDTRIKGQPMLAVYKRTADGSKRLADGDVARAGDLLRVGYNAGGRAFGVIVSVDGRGSVTMHLPPNGTRAARLHGDGTVVLLDQAYELDAAPRWEAFYFITAPQPFEIAPILDAARQIAAHGSAQPPRLPLSPGLEQVRFFLQKEAER